MKYIKKTLTIALCLAFSLGFMMASGLSMQKAYAADYKYKIKVYSGKEGYFGDENTHERTVEVKYGDKIKIVSTAENEDDIGLFVNGEKKADIRITLVDDKAYYLRGIKESGHDNKEYIVSAEFDAESDLSFSAVYGMPGGMVKYIVNYVDENEDPLAPSGEFYGMIGDKPVVSYIHIEGYTPQAYNLGKTLTGDPTIDIFTFKYAEGGTGTTTVIVNGGGGGAAGAGGTGADGINIADGETPTAGPADYVDLDDNQTPTTDGTDIDDTRSPGVNWPIIGGGAVIVAAIAAAAVALSRRRRSEEE